MSNFYDIIVIGGGPAAISAMLHLDRYNYSKIMVRDSFIGGLIRTAGNIENYPGFAGGISGLELSDKFKKEIKEREILNEVDRIISVEKIEGRFVSHSKSGKDYYSDAVIIATGTKPKELKREFSEKVNIDLFKRSIFELPPNIKAHKILIAGGGEAACDTALSIVRKGGKPVILCRGDRLKINDSLKNQIDEKEIEIHYSSTLKILKEQMSGKIFVEMENNKNLTGDFIMACIGRVPNKFDTIQVENGIFFAGDVSGNTDRYVGIAVGDGIKAAMNGIRFLDEKREE